MTKKLFYHFTRSSRLEQILEEGLRPVDEEEQNVPFLWEDPSPDNIVWLSADEQVPAFFSSLPEECFSNVRITVSLSLTNKRLQHWATWLKKNRPDVLAEYVEIDKASYGRYTEWHDWWFYEGTIAPNKFVAVDVDPRFALGATIKDYF